MNLPLPPQALRFIGDAPLERDEVGESPCPVYAFEQRGERFFLKLSPAIYAPTTYSVVREAAVLDWLTGRLPVPELVLVEEGEEHACMITRAVPGVPLYDLVDDGQHERVLAAFQEALRQLQGVPVDSCPLRAGIAERLRELDHLLANRLLADDVDLTQWPGLETTGDLLALLHKGLPDEGRVFAHGDLGDSNLFIDKRDRLYFIDLGRGGVADPWMDIAFAHRNLSEEISPAFADRLLAELPYPDQPERRRYFQQLDELF